MFSLDSALLLRCDWTDTCCSYAYLPLLAAERAWATAMQMKSVHSADPSSKGIVGSTRKHIISRLHKAVTYAQQLIPLFEAGSALDLLEVRGYVASLLGAYWMEKQRWDQCLQQYSLAQVIYTVLGNKNPQRTAVRDIVEGTIVPGLRYAAYQLQIPRTTSLDTLAVQNFPQERKAEIEAIDPTCLSEPSTSATAAATATTQLSSSGIEYPREITWRNRTVKIEDSSISLSLGAAAAAEAELTSTLQSASTQKVSSARKAAWYDRVIISSQDAVDATKTAIEELTAEGVNQSDKRMQALQVTRTAVNYRLVAWRIGRNRVATGLDDGLSNEELNCSPASLKKTDGASARARAAAAKKIAKQMSAPKRLDVLRRQVALYDATLQDLDAVKELPGVMGDEELVAELEGKKCYFQALR